MDGGCAPLPEGDFPHDGVAALTARARGLWPFLTEGNARRLVRSYGTRLDRILGDARDPEALGESFGGELSAAEVRYLIRHEFAETADDVLWRRSKLGLRLDRQAVAALTQFMETGVGRAAPSDPVCRDCPEARLASYLLAVDQGTTSTCVSVRRIAGRGRIRTARVSADLSAARLVEHDPQGIWTTAVATARAAMASADVTAENVAAIGITNQRETTILWDRTTGKPIHNAIVCVTAA